MIPFHVIETITWFFGDKFSLDTVLIEKRNENSIRLVATDGFMLMMVDVEHRGLSDFETVMVHKNDFYKIKQDSILSIFDNDIYFISVAGDIVTCKNVDGEFPDYEKAMHQIFKNPSNQSVDSKRFATVLKAAAKFSDFIDVLPGGKVDVFKVVAGNATFGIMPAKY